MKIRNKAALLSLSAILIVIATAFTTMAYLTTETTITHTFTIGDVSADFTTSGAATMTLGDDTLVQNGAIVKLIPNESYYIPVTVEMASDSEDAWVFVQIINPIADLEAPSGSELYGEFAMLNENGKYLTVEEQMQKNGWQPLDGYDGVYYFDEMPYDALSGHSVGAGWRLDLYNCFKVNCEAVKGTVMENNAELALEAAEGEEAETLSPDEEKLCLGEYKDTKIHTIVYLVQADGITTVEDAWAVFADKYAHNLAKFSPETQAEVNANA